MQWVPSFKMHLCCAFVALNWWGWDPSMSSSALSCTSSPLLLIIAKALKLANRDLEQIQGYHQEKAGLILMYSNMIFEWKMLLASPPQKKIPSGLKGNTEEFLKCQCLAPIPRYSELIGQVCILERRDFKATQIMLMWKHCSNKNSGSQTVSSDQVAKQKSEKILWWGQIHNFLSVSYFIQILTYLIISCKLYFHIGQWRSFGRIL